MTQLKGIDVSKFQGAIDWSKVSGIDFVLVRAGYGNDISQKDPMFDINVKGALSRGLAVGAYWFSYAVSAADAAKEAAIFNQILTPYRGKLAFPVAFDYEYDSIAYSQKQGVNPGNDLIDGIARTFLDSIKKGGWFVNLYTNCDFIRSGKFSANTVKSYDVWLADYSGAPDFSCGLQQTGSAGKIPGITGAVDMDVAFEDYPTIIRAGGYNGFPKPQPVNFKCDTTTDITLSSGQAYQFKVTSPQVPTAVIGTREVASLLPRYRSGNDSFFYLVGFGKPGSAAGIYVNGVKQFVVHIK
jgi:lysozyme